MTKRTSVKLLGITGNARENTELACAIIFRKSLLPPCTCFLLMHHLNWEHPRIIVKEANTIRRRIKEALKIHTRTTKNRDKGLELSEWDIIMIRSQSRGTPFSWSHFGANRLSLSSAVTACIFFDRVGKGERLSSGEKTRIRAFLT